MELVVKLLNEISEGRWDLFRISLEFKNHLKEPPTPAAKAALAALEYRLVGTGEEQRSYARPFAPLAEFPPTKELPSGIVRPPYLHTVPIEIVTLWGELVARIKAPVVSGRLHDLLWVRRYGERPYRHAHGAIEQYLLVSKLPQCDRMEATQLLRRALDLEREVGAGVDVQQSIGEQVAHLLYAESSSCEPRPGVVIGLLQILVKLSKDSLPSDFDLRGQLEHARELFAKDRPELREELFQLEEGLVRGNKAATDRLRLENAMAWLTWAERQENGFLRRQALADALKRAENAGAGDEADELRRGIRKLMQDTDGSDLVWKKSAVELKIPDTVREALVAEIVGNDDIAHALERFGTMVPLTGQPAKGTRVEKQPRFVWLELAAGMVVDEQGRPIRQVESAGEKGELMKTMEEKLAAELYGYFASEALDRIGQHYAPSQGQLVEVFGTHPITEAQAEGCARAFGHYWMGNYEEAILVALTRIEAALRNLLRQVGGTIYVEPKSKEAGHDKTLGRVLHDLKGKGELPLGWVRALEVILTDPIGLNLRNNYMHGQIDHVDHARKKWDSALVLLIATSLRQWPAPQGP